MEITLLPKNVLRIKEKNIAFAVDPQEKAPYNAAFAMLRAYDDLAVEDDTVTVSGPGEYEIGGVKMTGTRSGTDLLYSMRIGSVTILVGKLQALEKLQQKLKEHDIVIAACNEVSDVSFITALTSTVIMFYGDKAAEVATTLSGESVKKMGKYTVTRDKLPQELETIILE